MTTKQVQLLLLYLGYDSVGEADGSYGKKTMAAVRQFQQDFGGIQVDGLAGEETHKALRHAVAYGIEKTAEDSPATETEATGTFWDEIEYFTREEFRCKCGGKYCNGFPVEPVEATVRALDALRRKLGVPLTVTSGIRCENHNANYGGVKNSQHKTGLAADLHSTLSPETMYRAAEEVLGNSGGLGLYDWGIHVDTRAWKSRWNG